VSVTVSIGVAERTDNLSTPQAVIEAADRALYRAKDKGRNRVSQ
jgi:diguanylate cyclase (GGDEF)-like protein